MTRNGAARSRPISHLLVHHGNLGAYCPRIPSGHERLTIVRSLRYLTAVLVTSTVLTSGVALANTCQTDRLMCPTAMPVDGYCQCTSRGMTEDGTVVPTAHAHYNAGTGGCGANPQAPGCR
jgi:hypothetical protein